MKDILEQFKGRQHTPLIQFIKYAIAGVIATGVHVTVFYFSAILILPALNQHDVICQLLYLHVASVSDAVRARNAVLDNLIAFVFSNLTAYVINIKWVFESGRHHWLLEILFFYLVSGISTVIGTALMGFLINHFGMMTTGAFVSNAVVSLMINFVLRKFFIFKG